MLITLLTDFGDKDPYVGIMKGVIYGLNPQAQVIDLTHRVTPQKIREGAFLLQNSYLYFPTDTVHVAVVDPGVGTYRKGICIFVKEVGHFIGPDNGLFSYVLDRYPNAAVREILNPAWRLNEVSATFHGRDIFAPAAAHLTLGKAWEEIGPPLENWAAVTLPDLLPGWAEWMDSRSISGEIIHVDHFGTLVTNIPQTVFEGIPTGVLQTASIMFAGRYMVHKIRRTYGDENNGELVALFGSNGFLEIARVNGRADDLQGKDVPSPAWLGQKVVVKLRV